MSWWLSRICFTGPRTERIQFNTGQTDKTRKWKCLGKKTLLKMPLRQKNVFFLSQQIVAVAKGWANVIKFTAFDCYTGLVQFMISVWMQSLKSSRITYQITMSNHVRDMTWHIDGSIMPTWNKSIVNLIFFFEKKIKDNLAVTKSNSSNMYKNKKYRLFFISQ